MNKEELDRLIERMNKFAFSIGAPWAIRKTISPLGVEGVEIHPDVQKFIEENPDAFN